MNVTTAKKSADESGTKKLKKKKEKIFLVVKYDDDIGGWLDPDDSGPVGPWPCNQRKKKGSSFNPSKILK